MTSTSAPLIEEAIIKTLVYRDLFDYPLTAEEIHHFLIEQKSSPEAVGEALQGMVTEGKVQSSLRSDSLSRPRSKVRKRDDYYFLPGRKGVVGLRRKREGISRGKFQKATRYARLLRPIPWIKAVFATGALAVGNADEESDLDLLIVTAPRRLWMTRGLVFLILSLLGVKRGSRSTQTKDKVCPNMFLSELGLATPENEQNLYTAHEVIQAKPIWERAPLHQRLLTENRWVKKSLPNWEPRDRYSDTVVDLSKAQKLVSKASVRREKDRGISLYPCIFVSFFDLLEKIAYKLQLKYMEKRRTREVVSPERILFHPIDRAAEILPKLEERFERLVSSSPPLADHS